MDWWIAGLLPTASHGSKVGGECSPGRTESWGRMVLPALRLAGCPPHSAARAQTHFLADSEATILEIYCNPPDQVSNCRSMNLLLIHLALASADPAADAAGLISAGAVLVDEIRLPDGSHLVMLRDPWGAALQLCGHSQKLLGI